jgi:signal transduction histidine kinase
MKYKLNTKLVLSYLLISSIVVIIIAITTNIIFEGIFKNYVIKLQEDKNINVVNSLEMDYKDRYDWADVNFENVGMDALEHGLIIKIIDSDGKTLWNAMDHNSGMCAEMLAEMAHNMRKYYSDFDGGYTDREYTLESNGTIIGKVIIGYYGPYYFTENDIAFLNTFNTILLIVALASIMISVLIGFMVSRKISSNISNVIKATKEIANGRYHLIDEKADTREIIDLIDTVNDLSMTLESQEKLRKDLTSDIAHELRTPITTLQTHLEALKDGVFKITPERINSLYEEIIRVSRIVNDLDNLNKYDNNNVILNKSSFDLAKLIKKVSNNFEAELKEKNITLKIKGDSEVLADIDKITQVFINLISNAIKYTNSSGHINILISKDKKNVKIDVKDDGIGISESDLPFVFERFYRVDKSRTRSTGGSGIGLSIVKTIVEAHHGIVSIVSKLNVGTTVTIVIPSE